jgi:thiol-disulfide isomerase/thioredoxin
MKFRLFTTWCLAFILLLSGCQKNPPPRQGIWTGMITLADQKRLPFEVFLDLSQPAPSGYFVNGGERTPIPELYVQGDSLTFVISEYGAAMHALWDGKQYTGKFVRYRKDTTSNPFELIPAANTQDRPAKKASIEVPFVGKFQVLMKNPEGIDSSLVATFWSRGDSLYGTFIGADGDIGLMAGIQAGNSAKLGRFTGWQGQMMELTRELNTWTGTLYYRIPPSVSFELMPRTNALVQVPESKRTSVKDKRKPFVFSGLSVLGDTITVNDPRFKGKALIVDVMGTWCHNCMDAAPLLQKLHSDFNKDGLEIVALSFEIKNDLQLARKNLLMYQERYGIGFTVLFCGSTEKSNVDATLRSQLNNFSAYPTTLFIDRKGIVQYIHEGFQGPGTGEEYQRQIDLYYDMARKLIGKQSASR